MMRRFGIVSAIAALSAFQQPALGQGPETASALDNFPFEIRKSFKGSVKDAQAPGEILFIDPDQGGDFYALNIALRKKEGFELANWARLIPSAEFHRTDLDTNRVHTTDVGVTFEFESRLKNDWQLLTDVKLEGTRDSVANATSRTYSALFGVQKLFPSNRSENSAAGETACHRIENRWTPGQDVLVREFANDCVAVRRTLLMWWPVVGVERYERLPLKEKQNGETVVLAEALDESFAVIKGSLLFHPWARTLNESLEMVTSLEFRSRFGSSTSVSNSSRLFKTSLTFFFDEKRRIGLGGDYQDGSDPSRNFLDEETFSVGIKVKLN